MSICGTNIWNWSGISGRGKPAINLEQGFEPTIKLSLWQSVIYWRIANSMANVKISAWLLHFRMPAIERITLVGVADIQT